MTIRDVLQDFRGKGLHDNPCCKNDRFCLPHGELNENIEYDWDKIEDFIRQAIETAFKEIKLEKRRTEGKLRPQFSEGYNQALEEIKDKMQEFLGEENNNLQDKE